MLLPTGYWPGIRTDVLPWEPWTLPPKLQPIDREITIQIKRRDAGTREPRLRTREGLAAIGIECPYYYARLMTVIAADDGTDRVKQVARARSGGAERLRELSRQALTIAERIDAFLEEYRVFDLYSLDNRPASRANFEESKAHHWNVNDNFNRVRVAPDGLRVLAALAIERKERIAPSNAPGDIWRQVFAERMGYTWRDLTGKNPSETSTYFLNFVEAAFDSLGGPEEGRGLPWKDQIKTARERVEALPEWDQWDRLERGTEPPGVKRLPPGYLEERQKRRREQFNTAILEFIDARTAEEERDARANLLRWSFLPESEEGQATIQRIRASRI